jgi:hypothetical protein
VLLRALQCEPIQFHEITGAVFDTLAQIALMRGGYESAGDYLRRPATRTAATARKPASGTNGRFASSKPSWPRARRHEEAFAWRTNRRRRAPPAEAIQADLIACEALLGAERQRKPRHARAVGGRIDARAMPGAWGEFLRIRGALHGSPAGLSEAYHDIAQSASVFELVGEGYQSALSHLALGQLASRAGARRRPNTSSRRAASMFESLGAARDLAENAESRGDIPAAEPDLSRSPSMLTMRSCAGWWMPRRFRVCWRMKPRGHSRHAGCRCRRRLRRAQPTATSRLSRGAAATSIARGDRHARSGKSRHGLGCSERSDGSTTVRGTLRFSR